MKKFEILQLSNVTQRLEVTNATGNMVPVDLLEREFPQSFNV